MDIVQLKFDTMIHLWRFKEKMQLRNFEIRSVENILFCSLSDAAVEMAASQFGAHRIEQVYKTEQTFNH